MNKTAIIVGLTAVVSFALGFYVGDLKDVEAPTPASAPSPRSTEPLSDSAESGPVRSRTEDAVEAPTSETVVVVTTVAGERAVTQQLLESLERGARAAHASFFLLYDIPQGEIDAIVRGMAKGQIEEMVYLEKLGDLQSNAPLGGTSLSEADQQAVDELVAAHKRERDATMRELLGIYYDDFQRYFPTLKEHEIIAEVSTALNQPINSVTRDELLQIMVEEGLYDWQRPESASVDVPLLESQSQQERLERDRRRIELFKQKVRRIKERSRSYLSIDEHKVLAEIPDRNVEWPKTNARLTELSDND